MLVIASPPAGRASPLQDTPSEKDRIASEKEAMRALGVKVFAESDAQDRAFQSELNTLNLFEVLRPGWLAVRPNFTEAHARIQKARDLFARYYDQKLKRDLRVAAEIQTLELPADLRQAAEAGFKKSFAASQPRQVKSKDLDLAILSQMDATISFLTVHKSSWTIQNGKVRFSASNDALAYDLHIDNIRKAVAASAAMDAESRADQAKSRAAVAADLK